MCESCSEMINHNKPKANEIEAVVQGYRIQGRMYLSASDLELAFRKAGYDYVADVIETYAKGIEKQL